MAALYVAQTGFGAENGSSAANAIAIGDVTYANDNTYYFLGTITTTIDLSGKHRVVLRGDEASDPCTISGITGSGIYTHGSSDDIEIVGFTIDACSSRGIYLVESAAVHNYFKVHDCVITGCGSSGIKVGASAGGSVCTGVEIYDNTIASNQTGIFCVDAPGMIVRNNVLTGNGVAGAGNNTDSISIDNGCDDALIELNVVTGQLGEDGAGIDIQNSTGTGTTVVRSNKITNGEGFGLHQVGIEDADFYGNLVLGCQNGFFIKSGDGPISPTTCNFYNNTTDSGIRVGQTTADNEEIELDLKNNIITSDSSAAVWVDADVALNITSANNCFGAGATYTNFTKDATDLEVDPGLDASSVPTNDSVINGGSRWWLGANPVGPDGEPLTDWTVTIGALQSTEVPFHPLNLK